MPELKDNPHMAPEQTQQILAKAEAIVQHRSYTPYNAVEVKRLCDWAVDKAEYYWSGYYD